MNDLSNILKWFAIALLSTTNVFILDILISKIIR